MALANGPDGYLQIVRIVDDAMWRSAACASAQVTVWRVNYHINTDKTGSKEMANRYVLNHANPKMLFKGDGIYGGICYSYHVVAFVSSVPSTVPTAHVSDNQSDTYWRARGGKLMWHEASTSGCPGHNP